MQRWFPLRPSSDSSQRQSPLGSPIPTEQKHADFFFFFFKWGISNFCLPGGSFFLFLFFTGAAEWEGARHVYAAHLASGSVALNPLPSSISAPHQAVPPLRRQDRAQRQSWAGKGSRGCPILQPDRRGPSSRRREIGTYPFGSWARLARAVASGRPTWTTLPPSSIRRRHNSASREPRNCSSSSYCPSRRSVAPGRGSLYTVPPA